VWLDEHRPDLVLTGHVHEPPFHPDGSWYDRIDGTLVCNAGRQLGPVPAHLIVDTDVNEVMWWSFERSETIPGRSANCSSRSPRNVVTRCRRVARVTAMWCPKSGTSRNNRSASSTRRTTLGSTAIARSVASRSV
jgi:hypothetical protein